MAIKEALLSWDEPVLSPGRVVRILKSLGDSVLKNEPVIAISIRGVVRELTVDSVGTVVAHLIKVGDVAGPESAILSLETQPFPQSAKEVADLRLMLAQDPVVADFTILVREAQNGDGIPVIYAVPAGSASFEGLTTLLNDRFPNALLVPVTALPLDAFGKPDHALLERLAVPEAGLMADLNRQLPTHAAAILTAPGQPPEPRLHLNDLIPAKQAEPTKWVHVPVPEVVEPEGRLSEALPAVVDGGSFSSQDLPTTLPALLSRAVERSPARGIHYFHEDGSESCQSYATLLEEASIIGGGLKKRGLKPGRPILLQLADRRDYITGIWGCLLAGLVPTPAAIAPSYEESNGVVLRLHSAWRMLEHPAILCGDAMKPALEGLDRILDMPNPNVIGLGELTQAQPVAAHQGSGDDLTLMLMTSGSTGKPKLVTHSHQTLIRREKATCHALALTETDVSLCWLPLDHVASVVDFHIRDIYLGADQVQVPTKSVLADPLLWPELLSKCRATSTWAPNFAYALIADEEAAIRERDWDLSAMRHFINGGEAIVVRTARRFLQVLACQKLPPTAMTPVWGMSETASGVTYAPDFHLDNSSDDDQFVDLGPPIPGFQLRIVDDRGEPVLGDRVGRFEVRGIAVTPGYYQAPEKNAEVYTEDGWFRTGDLAKLSNGRLTLTGREKDVIIIHGLNYYSHEIEAVVDEVDGVQPSFTAAIAVRDRDGSSERLAVIFHSAVKHPAARAELIASIRDHVLRSNGLFAKYVLPLDKAQIPKTGIGKIMRSRLKQSFETGGFDNVIRQLDLEAGNENTLPNWFFKPVWHNAPSAAVRLALKPRHVLLFMDESGLGQSLCRALEAHAVRVTPVVLAASFEPRDKGFRMDADAPADYVRLLEELRDNAPDAVVHLGDYGFPANPLSPEPQAARPSGPVYRVLHLIQAWLGVFGESQTADWLHVASHSQPHSDTPDPARAAVPALLNCAARELGAVRVRHLDLPLNNPAVNTAHILSEMRSVGCETEVRIRNSKRQTVALERVNFNEKRRAPLPFRDGGTYLVTGGLGGIGKVFCEYLLERFHANLILVGRSPLYEGGDEQRSLTFAALRGLPGQVFYESADVADSQQLQTAVDRCLTDLAGGLDGVVHLAAGFHESNLAAESDERMAALMRPKLAGARALFEVVRTHDAFFVGFSSIASFFGGAGLGAYAAANRALERFGDVMRLVHGAEVHMLSFSIWDGLGVSSDFAMQDLVRMMGYEILTPRSGIAATMAALGSGECEVMVGLNGANANIRARQRGVLSAPLEQVSLFSEGGEALPELDWVDRFGVALPLQTSEIEVLPRDPDGNLDLPRLRLMAQADESDSGRLPETPLEKRLAGLFGDVLGVRDVGLTDHFFQLGGHSIQALKLLTRVRDELGVEIQGPVFLAGPTVAQLAELVIGGRDEQAPAETWPVIEPVPAERFQPFPLNEIQQAYWLGRTAEFELSDVAMHLYLEVALDDPNTAHLEETWNQVIARHDMLRAVILADGRERVLPSVARYEIQITDWSSHAEPERERRLLALRDELSHQKLAPDHWPGFDIRLVDCGEGDFRLFVSMAAIHLDGGSFFLVMSEWGKRYRNPDHKPESLPLAFRDYALAVNQMKTGERYKASDSYWRKRLPHLPPAPSLPYAKEAASITGYRMSHRSFRLPRQTWEALKNTASRHGLSRSAVGLAAYGCVIGAWSRGLAMTLNVTLLNRLPLHPDVNRITGDFTSVILAGLTRDPEDGFESYARRVQEQLWTDMEHRHVAGVTVLRELGRLTGQTGKALMPVVFTSALDLDMDGATSPQSAVRDLGPVICQMSQTPQVLLDCQLFEDEGDLLCMWDAVDEAFPDGMLDEMMTAYDHLLRDLARPTAWQDWPALVSGRQTAAREAANRTAEPVSDALLHELFEQRAALQPNAPAILSATLEMSYAELASRARRLAAVLRAEGATPNTLIAVVMEKGWEQVVAVLAVQMSGAAYMPVSSTMPRQRRDYLLENGDVTLVLTQSRFETGLEWPAGVLVLSVDGAVAQDGDDSPLERVNSCRDLAYVIFTSGSTGRPKGVVIDHRGAVNTIRDINRRFAVSPSDRVFALSSLSFDLSVYDVFGTLAAGAAIIMPRAGASRDPEHWTELCDSHGVTFWNSVPALMDMWVSYIAGHHRRLPDSLRAVLMSGDWIPLPLPDRIHELGSGVNVTSLGGATEASIWSISYPIGKVDPAWTSVPYGKPMVNQRFHVLNPAMEPCPIWTPGELHIAGTGLAKGYWKDQEKTAASFINHPVTGERLYKTGDLGRYLPDGNIEFLGREDFQVKIQGHRIELGEIEAVLLEHDDVIQAVVVAAGKGRQGRRLVAHLVPVESHAGGEALRDFLDNRLPDYMVPPVFVMHESLPLTPTGKVDRGALAREHDLPVEEEVGFVAPRTPLEEQLTALWREILELDRLGVHDNLIYMGCNSLIAINAVSRMREMLEVYVPLRLVLSDHPTVARLAEEVGHLQADGEAVEQSLPEIVADPDAAYAAFPLNDIQEAYWIGRGGDFELGGVAAYFYLEVALEELDVDRLERAWQRVIDRHPMLRAIFLADGSQKVLDDKEAYRIETMDLRDREDARQRLLSIRDRMSQQVFATDKWPLFECRVSHLHDDLYHLHFGLDLLIADAWSVQILFGDLEKFYREPELDREPLAVSFRDYLLTERKLRESGLYKTSKDYWWERLAQLPGPPQLPLVKDFGAIAKPKFDRCQGTLTPETWDTLTRLAREKGLSPSGLLLAAFAEVLGRWSRSRHFCLNVTTFNRMALHPQIDHVVGDFTSLNLLEVEGVQPNFQERARAVQERLWRDLEHRHVSGLEVLRELRRLRDVTGGTLAPIVFTSLLDSYGKSGDFVPLGGDVAFAGSQTPQVWLDYQVREQDGVLYMTWDIVAELLPKGLPQDLFDAYTHLLQSLADDPDSWLEADLPLLPSEQIEQRDEVNATDGPHSKRLLHELFAETASRQPHHTAVVAWDHSLSYGELNAWRSRIANLLIAYGAGANTLVAVVMEKGWEQVVATLGVCSAGAAYLPMDPALPKGRRDFLLENGEVSIVLTQARFETTLEWPDSVRVINVEGAEVAAQEEVITPVPVKHDDLAYVIFTSGSTGRPKGVMIDHRGAVNTILDINSRFHVTPDDRVFALSALSFDLSVFDIFGALAAGATVVMPRPGSQRDAMHWLEMVHEQKVTLWNSVPALVDMLVSFAEGQEKTLPDSLRLVMMSGDWIPLNLPDRLRELGQHAVPISLGGATEASIWSILYPIERVDPAWKSIPYGKPMVNQRFYVFSKAMEVCPTWVAGDLFISGQGLARGYWRDAEKTALSFTAHPVTGERLYRTGDMGRYLPDGNIEFMGREDFQVKVQGHRIELGEIETCLLEHECVEGAVVDAAGKPKGPRRLVAYVVLRPGFEADLEELRAHLGTALPDYMVPGLFVILDKIPLTANGKVDRKALPQPDMGDLGERGFAAPRTPLETELAQIWCEMLGLEEVDREHTFYELGGNSLMVIQLFTRLQPMARGELSLRRFFDDATISGLATLIARARAEAGDRAGADAGDLPAVILEPEQRFKPFPLNDIQQAYWMGRNEGLELGGVAAHFYFELELKTDRPERIQRAWQQLIGRHDMLRSIVLPDGQQKVLDPVPNFVVPINDLRGQDPHGVLMETRDRLSHQVVDTGKWPLFEIVVNRLEDRRVIAHFSFDLLIADAWSALLLFQDFTRLYHGEPVQWEPLEIGFRDYLRSMERLPESTAWQRSRAFWQQRLATIPAAPELPMLCEPGAISKPQFERRSARLELDTWRSLKAHAARLGLTPSGLLLAVYAEVLSVWSASPQFTINVTTFNRLPIHPQIDELVGDFTSLTLLAVDHTAADSFEQLARRVQEQLWEDLDHRHYSGIQVMRDLAAARGRAPGALMPVVFTSRLFGAEDVLPSLPANDDGSPSQVIYSVSQTPQVWLDKQVYEEDGTLAWTWDTVSGLFPAEMIDDMFVAYVNLLDRLAFEESVWRAACFDLMSQQQAALMADLNQTDTPFPDLLLHDAFLAGVERHPERIAVIAPDAALTYAQLADLSGTLAGHLHDLGARPERLVAIIMEKGWEQVVAAYGVLRSGAAYLPVDPHWPKERRDYVLDRGLVSLALIQTGWEDRLDLPEHITHLTLDQVEDHPAFEFPRDSSHLAYVIFTSGSTGKPKGVAIEHRSAVNTIQDINQRFGVGENDRALAVSALHFDLSVYDFFGPLSVGGAVVIPEQLENPDPYHWLDMADEHKVTIWNSVPALMELLVTFAEDQGAFLPDGLRLALLSGDWVPLDISSRLQAQVPDIKVISLGGATEGSIWSIFYPIGDTKPEWASIPYGKALANQRMSIRDAKLRPRPFWVPGDIYIGGVGVAREYWRDEQLTQAAFRIDPEDGSRIYRTGDLGRLLPDGNIEFLGRADFQVKVQGHRIELGEIESALMRHEKVKAAVVTAPWIDGVGGPGGQRRLVGYVVPAGGEALEKDVLAAHLAEMVPHYMVPAFFVNLEALPLTANGKVDRKALPEPDQVLTVSGGEAPRSAAEARVAAVWRDVLDLESVGVFDNFFDLGGNSLSALKLLTRLRESFEVPLSLRDLFTHLTVAALTEAIEEMRDGNQTAEVEEHMPQIEPNLADRHKPFPLTPVQQAYWIGRMEGIEGGNIAAHAYYELDAQNFDLNAFELGFQAMIKRHDSLRIVIGSDGQQRILADVPAYEIAQQDLSAMSEAERERGIEALRDRMSHQVLPADKWPIFEVCASHLGNNLTRLHLSFDLLISDAWSSRVLFHELAQHLNGKTLEPLEISFRDYVTGNLELQESQRYQRAREYWGARLETLPPAPDLPTIKRPDLWLAPRFTRYSSQLDAQTWERLKERANQAGITHSGMLLTAFCHILSRWSNNRHFMLNLTTFNRLPLHRQVNNLMGDFTSLTLLAADMGAADRFIDQARLLQEQLWSDLDHRAMNGVEVLREMNRVRGGEMAPVAPIVFTSRLFHDDKFFSGNDMSETFGEVVYSVSQTPQVWLDHQVVEEQGCLQWTWDAMEGLFPDSMIDEMFANYLMVLERLSWDEAAWTGPAACLIPGLEPPRPEPVALTDQSYCELLHQAFYQRAAEAPDSPAVIGVDRTLNYGELAAAANRVAHWLRDHGAQPDRLVGIVMEKGWEQVVAAVGVLASGAAYLPIDVHLPQERIRILLERGEVGLVLTQSTMADKLSLPVSGQGRIPCLNVDTAAFDTALDDAPLTNVQRPDHLAYVIFTSGSTGLPKGVALEHRAAVNTLQDVNDRFGVSASDRVLAISSLSFDLSVYDVFGLLSVGGALVLPRVGSERDPAHWASRMNEGGVTIWNSVPALMEMLSRASEAATEATEKLPECLRLVLMSGDWIPVGLTDHIRTQVAGVRVISLGGATEAAIWSIMYPIDWIDPDWASVPYGKAMRYQSFHVLDEGLQQRPFHVAGELFIGGVGLAREYWRDGERTRDSFISHPVTGARLYRTGDHGRLLPDGNIEFLGRRDSQVKVLGYRVELGEIEAVLSEHPGIETAVVNAPYTDPTAVGSGRHRRLVAYVTPKETDADGVVSDSVTIDLTHPAAAARVPSRADRPLGLVEFADLLGCLRQIQPDGVAVPKYRYPSGGGLYPVQIYVAVAGVEGLESGLYMYHPREHQLMLISADHGLPQGTEADFVMHLVGRRTAVGPMYPKLAQMFCLLEAGYLGRLFLDEAAGFGLAMKSVGDDLYRAIEPRLELEEHDLWVKTLAGAVNPADLEQISAIAGFGDRPQATPDVDFSHIAIKDQLEKLTFKMKMLGLPNPTRVEKRITLPGAVLTDALIERFSIRRTCRLYEPRAVPLDDFARLLSCLRTPDPMDYYVHIKAGRVTGLRGGAYRYDPEGHQLIMLTPDAGIDRMNHGGVNRPVHDSAAFTIFLVTGAEGWAFPDARLIQAGDLGQKIADMGPAMDIGICAIGGMNFKPLKEMFKLGPNENAIHLFMGGIQTRTLTLAEALEEQMTVQRMMMEEMSNPDTPGPKKEKRAVGIVESHGLQVDELKSFVGARLPEYMVPLKWVFLDEIPLTSNGKVDRKALNKFSVEEKVKPVEKHDGIPKDELERTIVDLVKRVLAREEIGTYDNFFEIGANSLQLVQLHGQLKETLGRQIAITHIFANPTVSALADALRGEGRDEALELGKARARKRLAKRKKGRR